MLESKERSTKRWDNKNGAAGHEIAAQDEVNPGGEDGQEEKGPRLQAPEDMPLSQVRILGASARAEARLGLLCQLINELHAETGAFIEHNSRPRAPIGFLAAVPEPAQVDGIIKSCQEIIRLLKPILLEPASMQVDAVLQACARELKPLMRDMVSCLVENSGSYGVPEGLLPAVTVRCRKYEQTLEALVIELNNVRLSLSIEQAQKLSA